MNEWQPIETAPVGQRLADELRSVTAERDRMRPVVEAAQRWRADWTPESATDLINAVETYEPYSPSPPPRQLLEQLRAENEYLRGLVAIIPDAPCAYCKLSDMSKCPSGFPGCARADDLFLASETLDGLYASMPLSTLIKRCFMCKLRSLITRLCKHQVLLIVGFPLAVGLLVFLIAYIVRHVTFPL